MKPKGLAVIVISTLTIIAILIVIKTISHNFSCKTSLLFVKTLAVPIAILSKFYAKMFYNISLWSIFDTNHSKYFKFKNYNSFQQQKY
jgi:hypothetical protein